MVTQLAYLFLVALVAIQRLLELVISRHHELLLRAKGAIEHGRAHYPAMVALQVAFLVACALEVVTMRRPFHLWLAIPMIVMLLLAQGVRYWSITTLGERWTVRVFELPGAPLVTGGPYRFLHHPNYVAVVIEIVALPMVHTAWLTALVFTVLNALMLVIRIRSEEQALGRRATA